MGIESLQGHSLQEESYHGDWLQRHSLEEQARLNKSGKDSEKSKRSEEDWKNSAWNEKDWLQIYPRHQQPLTAGSYFDRVKAVFKHSKTDQVNQGVPVKKSNLKKNVGEKRKGIKVQFNEVVTVQEIQYYNKGKTCWKKENTYYDWYLKPLFTLGTEGRLVRNLEDPPKEWINRSKKTDQERLAHRKKLQDSVEKALANTDTPVLHGRVTNSTGIFSCIYNLFASFFRKKEQDNR